MIEYRIINQAEYLSISELRWIFQCEENPSLKSEQRDSFINDCLSHILNDQSFIHFGAFKNKKLIAMASLCIINKIPRPNKIIDPIGYLTNVFVVKKYRNQQIGSNLINNINNYAKVNDLELIIVWPSDQSANFYQKLQYHPQNQPIIHKLREY